MSNEPDVRAALRDAARNVAIAKLSSFEIACHQIGAMVLSSSFPKTAAVDGLYEIALANGLLRIHGGDLIHSLIADGFGGEVRA